MNTNIKLHSIALASAIVILFLILVSSTASAATEQNASSAITETKITTNDTIQALTSGTEEISGNTEVTVYNEDLALVKEKREIDLKNGVNSLEYTKVASQIDPTSVLVEDSTNNKTAVLEQEYKYDLISSSNLLDEYIEKNITVTDREGKTHTGKLLSHDEKGVVLERSDGSVVALDFSNVEFSNTSGLLTKPALVWQIYSPTAGKRDLLISYLTGGLSWSTNYIVKTNANSTKADIRSWVSIDNKAGITFDNAKLKLVAGDIHRVSSSAPIYQYAKAMAVSTSDEAFSETPISEYHLYTLEKPVTLTNNQAKQISLLSADSVPVQKELVFDSWKGDKVQVILNMENSEAKGLGKPLPKGVVRIYQPDSEGQLQFIGEDQIDHTPVDEKIKVTVGNAFDIIGKRAQTGFEQISNNVERTSYKIELNNSKSEAQNVTVVEHFDGDWEIVKSSDKYEKTDAFTVEFKVSVPAKATKTISYTVENKVRAPTPITENAANENLNTENTTAENSSTKNTTTEIQR
jgi:hypothetical protein